MYRHLALPLILGCVAITGCGPVLDFLFPSGGKETGSPELKAFQSEQEMHDYFLSEIHSRNDGLLDFTRGEDVFALDADAMDATSGGSMEDTAPPPSAAPTDDGGAGADSVASTDPEHSDTTIQEEGVDEADVVKTDGTYLYVIDGGTLRIVRIWPPEELTALSEVTLEGSGREIYLYNNKIIALTATDSFYLTDAMGTPVSTTTDDVVMVDAPMGDDGMMDGGDGMGGMTVSTDEVAQVYQRPRTVVTIIDMALPEEPVILSQTKFDGWPTSSRMVDGVLHLVIANHQYYYYDIMPMMGRAELDTSSVSAEQLLPRFERVVSDGAPSSGPALTWRSMYHPTDSDGFGVVSVVSLDVDNDGAFSAVGIVAEPGLIYSSTEALYLTDTEWNAFGAQRETTDIYKLTYVEGRATPTATGSVPGRILNQYSMGEHEGYLRVATTVAPTFSMFNQRTERHNNVYVLDEVGGKLEVVGSVEKIAPREDIRSARFVGDRGYVVTFEQIDPLFTLDLSDPTDPRVVGELEVPGFSTFLLPMDENHLLAVGQYIPTGGAWWGWGVQLSIFDVSDFAKPVRKYNVVIGGDSGVSSDALYDPKALTYFAQGGMLALPVSMYGGGGFMEIDVVAVDVDGGGTDAAPPPPEDSSDVVASPGLDEFYGLMVYEVSVENGFTEAGRISTQFDDSGYYWASFTRGVFIEDHLFAVTNNGLRGGPVSDLGEAPYELVFTSSDPTDANTGTGGDATD